MGPEDYSIEETEKMPPEVQFLPPDKKRDENVEVLRACMESMLLLCSTAEGRQTMRDRGIYAIVRKVHEACSDEEVREVAERWVQVVIGEEEEMGRNRGEDGREANRVEEVVDEEDEESKIVEIL